MPRLLISVLLLLVGSARVAAGKAPGVADDLTNKLVTFDEVLDEIRKAHASGEWKNAAWKPHATKTWLEHLLAEVKRATKREKLELPVAFDKVKPATAEQTVQQNMLHVVNNGRLSFLRQSIVLADGNVDLTSAENCIIIARGAVTVSSSQRNLIIGGQFVGISSDRPANFRPAPLPAPGAAPAPAPAETPEGSVILSAGILDMSSAYGTVCCGLERVIVSYTNQGAMLLNSPQRELGTSARFEVVDDPQIPFTRKAGKNPLQDKLNVTQIVPGTAGLVVIERHGVEYVLRPEAAMTDERGQPIAGLENWKLEFLGRNYALFAKDRQYAGFYVKR